jgi:hypothetical protein
LAVAALLTLLAPPLAVGQLAADRRAVAGVEIGHDALVGAAVRAEVITLPRDRSREDLAGIGDAVQVTPVVAVGRPPCAGVQRSVGPESLSSEPAAMIASKSS